MAESAGSPSNLRITIQYQGKAIELSLPESSTLEQLSHHVEETLSVPASNQKFLISPKPGMVKPPFSNEHSSIPLSSLSARKITLLGSTVQQVEALNRSIASSAPRTKYSGPLKTATPARTRDWRTSQDSVTYTFLKIEPLPYLPNSERSRDFLKRLAADPGIKRSMARHKWTVGMLTEMNPAEHTTHESRTLGLNRNRGEVIELRLRTDAYDGYRDYKVIRKTLCHELAHNVFGEHDRNFWDLCHSIEKEVERDDYSRGGHSVGTQEYYESSEEVADHGGWTGGSYVLGKGEVGQETNHDAPQDAMSRRDVLAKAAEERAKKAREPKQ